MRWRLLLLAVLLVVPVLRADDIDKKYPLDTPLRILSEDLASPRYRELVTQKMLTTDLAAEWKRVATSDNADSFLEKHGGKEKVLADADLKTAYERRLKIRTDFLDLMREGYKRYKQVPPFDKGEKVVPETTVTKTPGGGGAALSVVLPCPNAEANWPRFRGPTGMGLTGLKELPTKWSDKDGIAWRSPLPGKGNSSPIVWGDRIFVTSCSPDGKVRTMHCYRATDGQKLWSQDAPATAPEEPVRDKNGFASSTPITDGERVIAFFGSVGLVCWDYSGKQLWHYADLKVGITHGTGASPVLYKDLVILSQDQNLKEPLFVAVNKVTGKEVWKKTRAKSMGWNTPLIVRVGDRDEMMLQSLFRVVSYDPSTGDELWSLNGPTVEVIPMLVIGPDLVYSISGRNGPVIAFKPGGKGDVTETAIVWQANRGGPLVPSPMYLDGRLYFTTDTGIINCLDGKTGKLLWSRRLEAEFSSSPIEAGGLLYFTGENGVTYLLKAGDKYDLVGQNDLGTPTLASPAVAQGRLIFRTDGELICVGKK
jgi:outer membrane protein assembly factor BamB